jgi:uncharacterized repeat protein (TIGR04138 family)
MHELAQAIATIVQKDRRYAIDAYFFVFEALAYAQKVLKFGAAHCDDETAVPEPRAERHVTGQELCEALRLFALEQFGYMAKCVLNSWGLYSTGDFGEIVFNLIRAGQMRKTPEDRREDFDDHFDFDSLQQSFRISMPD